MHRVASAVSVGVVIVATLASSAPAGRATFPGQNGRFAFGFGGGTIMTENPDGTDRKTIVPLTSGVAVGATEPAWSADGTKLAYSSKIGGTGGIFIVKDRKSTRLNSSHITIS